MARGTSVKLQVPRAFCLRPARPIISNLRGGKPAHYNNLASELAANSLAAKRCSFALNNRGNIAFRGGHL